MEHIRQYGTTDSYSTEAVHHSQLNVCLLIRLLQGELEHRTPKMRYKCTDRKEFVKQLARIERREARIHRLRPPKSGNQAPDEGCATLPKAHHTIGQTESFPEHIGQFVQRHSGDPAVEVCVLVFLPSLSDSLNSCSISFPH